MFPISKRLARTLGRRSRRTVELTDACGQARSRGDAPRGSALVLVVGALALVSIFAAIYVTVGRSDKRTSSALEQNRKVAEFPLRFSDYFAQIIADDRLAVETRIEMSFNGDGGPVGGTWGGGGGGGGSSAGAPEIRQRFYREATDFPYTAYGLRSLPNLVTGVSGNRPLLGFNAPGTSYDPDTGLGGWTVSGSTITAQISELALDPRVASDPWLASTEPTYLGSPSFNDRLFSRDKSSGSVADQARMFYLDKRDWAHITNISPDGLFVNLWNLRPEAGGFDAQSGFTRGGFTNGTPRMSDNLSLIRMSGGVGDPLQAMDVRDSSSGIWIPGYDQPVTWDSTPYGSEDPENHPAVWSNNQRFMLIPLEQPFLFENPSGYGNPSGDGDPFANWSSPYYPSYQYADADGDGLADSRWFELTDSSDTTGFNQWLTRDLASVDGYRLFVAARVIDLSAMVNVNTATDMLAPPTNVAPLGSTPADIDARRIISLSDVARNWLDWKNLSKNLAPTSIKRDGRPGWAGGQDTDPYSDYSNYQLDDNLQPFDGRRVGWYAYDALGKAIASEGALGETISGGGPRSALFETSRFYDDIANESLGSSDSDAARRRLFWGLDIGSLDIQDPTSVGRASIAAGWFDMSDLAELLTFRGVNDDQVFSRLEQTVQGRYDNNAGGSNVSASALRLGPLFSERPTDMDRKRHDTLYGDYDRNRPYEPTGQVDPDTLALLAVSPRLRLTTYSGATDIFGGRLGSTQLMNLETGDVPEYLPEFLDDISSGGTSRLDVFKAYFESLAGAARTRKSWDPSNTYYNELKTTFYGHNGPELATRLSGHLAANLYDMYDNNDEPTALSIWVVTPGTSGVFPSGDPALTWGGTEIDLSDIDGQNYTAEDAAYVDAPAYTVFGVEAYPVLTEAASMVVVTDAANSINGSSDDGGGGNPWQPVGGGPDEEITIDVDGWDGDPGGTYSANQAWQRNADLAFVAIAFQVANPFEETIELSDYYFEYNGHFFRAGAGQLEGGHAKTLYCLANPDFQDVAEKWEDLLQGYSSGATFTDAEVQTWCNQQFKQPSTGDNPVDDPERVERFNPNGGTVLTGYSNFLATAGAGAPGRPATDEVVRLWRRMPANPDQDLLVDRLRQPAPVGPGGLVGIIEPVLNPVPESINKAEVSGTVAGPETSGGNIGGNDNTGFTFVFYGSISRGDHPDSADGDHAVSSSVPGNGNGVLPAWMIDGHSQTTLAEKTPLVNSLSGSGEDARPDQLKSDYFIVTRRYAFKSFDDFVDETSPIIATVATHPNEKNSLASPVGNDVFDRASALIEPLHSNTLYTPATEPRASLYPELVSTDRDVYESVQNPYSSGTRDVPLVRLTDLLQVPAVGWVYRPDPASPSQWDEDNWTTFGEALAYAMDIMTVSDRDGDPVLAQLTREVTLNGSARTEFVLDNLNLRTDAYAPFFNANASSDTLKLYEPDQGDLRIGSGIPLALDLLSRFRTLGPDNAGEALTAKVMGRINIGTAGADVLRSVPGLAPSLETDTALAPEWWGSNTSVLTSFTGGLPDAIADSATFEAPDVAAQLISYRDRLAGEYRHSSYDYSTLAGVLGGGPLGYRSFDFLGPAPWSLPDAARVAMRNFKPEPNPSPNELGRTILTGIEGLREQPGFASVAEAGAAVFSRGYLVNQFGLADTDFDRIKQNQPTYLGIDEDASGAPRNTGSATSGSDVVTIETHLYNDQNDAIPNDTEERLAILNALSGTTSVRSDVFAVWFVVHGYREADVENLRPSDPLVPSYARRVLMVIDRSNVTSVGQAPKVLLYKELPL